MFALFASVSAVAPGQVKDILFERLAVEQGLAHTAIYGINQDSLGFIWFGTPDGLIRYDGYEFKIYDHTRFFFDAAIYVENRGSIWSNGSGEVHRIDLATGKIIRYPFGTGYLAWRSFKEAYGDLWVGSIGVGIGRYIRSEDRIRQYRHDPTNDSSLCNDTVRVTCVDRQGNLWIGTNSGLDRFDTSSGMFAHYDQLRRNRVMAILEDKDHGLWIGTNNGLYRLDESHGVCESYRDESPGGSYVWAVFQDSRGELWLGTDGGFARFDKSTHRFDFVQASRRDSRVLPDVWLKHPIVEDHKGRIWAATTAGLAIFDREKRVLDFLPSDPQDPRTIPERDVVTALFEDRSGGIWVGMQNGGLCLLDRTRVPFLHVGQNPYDKMQLSQAYVSAILEDSAGTIWVGSPHGLDRLDLTNAARMHYGDPSRRPGTLWDTKVTNIVEDPPGILWLASNEGIFRMNKKTGMFTRFPPHPGQGIPSNQVLSLCADNSAVLWVGGGIANGHLDRFDRNALRFTDHLFLSFDPSAVGQRAIPLSFLLVDKSGLLWFTQGGLGAFDITSGKATFFAANPDSARGMSGWAEALCEDATGTLWVFTTSGLDCFDRANNTFSHITMKDQIASGNVFAMLADNSGSSQSVGHPGNLWLLTPMGVSRLDPTTGTIWNYGPSDGVPISPSTYVYACFKHRDGHLYFGGTNGFVRFHPDSVKINRWIPPVVLSGFKKFYAEAELDSAITAKKVITLSHAENVISFEFAALNYTRPEKNQFAYKLEGFDRDWVNCGTRRTATYTNLDPGKYVFRVKGSNNDGIWNEEGTSLSIIITPPWWRTTWAYLAYVIIIGTALYSVYRARINRLRLVHTLQLEHLEASKMREVDEIKTRFFTNISHEFRTPLTLILGPAKQLLEHFDDHEITAKADLIHRSARKLNRLVDELLDLAKIEAGEMKLNARPINVISAVHDVVLTFQPLAERKGITCRWSFNEDEIVAYLDKDKVDKILTNVLSNAFKFTPDGGTVDVRVNSQPSKEGGAVTITIGDTGIGIPKEHMDKIFDRFYQVDGSHTREQEGTGIGLALTKELIELHKGRIEVESVEGQGSTFRLIFPLGTAHLAPEQMGGDEGEYEHEKTTPQVDEGGIGTDECERDNGVTEKSVLPSLLIVEDNADVRMYVSSILGNTYRIIEAHDGEEGLEKSRGCIPDLIITDIMMPKMDGYQLCGKLKADSRTSHIPVIMLTAKATSKDKINGFEIGADDYIMKPFEARELEARIRNLIEQRKRLHEHFRAHGLVEMVEKSLTSVDQKFLQRAVEVINEHIADASFDIAVFAEEMAVSRSLLFKKVESLLGEPPKEIVKRTRLNKAAKLIEARAGNVSEIALEVGFSNPSYFTECFRKQFGSTPTYYFRNLPKPSSRREGPKPI